MVFHFSNFSVKWKKYSKGCEKMSTKDKKLDQIIKTIDENDIKF